MSERSLRVVVAEDDPAHAEAIRRALGRGLAGAEIELVATLREYRAATTARAPDIALVDFVLPDGRAVAVLDGSPEARRFPVLIMTSHGDEQVAVEAMKAGALDYIVKSPEAFAALAHSVTRALREWELIEARRRDQGRIVHLNSVLRGIRAVNQLITRFTELAPLLQAACDALVGGNGYRAVWIALRGDAGLRLVAHAGLSDERAQRLANALATGTVPCCVRGATEKGGATGVRLPMPECVGCALEGAYPECGVLAAPMIDHDEQHGVMAAAVPAEHVFDGDEQALFDELVQDLAFANFRLGLEARHRDAVTSLERSETRYRELVENLVELVYSVDVQGRITYMSPAVRTSYGYEPESMVGRNFAELAYSEDVAELIAYLQRTLVGEVGSHEFRAIDAAGEIRRLRATSRAHRDGGRVTGVDGVLFEVTELHRAMEAERRSASRWRSTFDAITDVVCVLTNDGRIAEINQSGLASLGMVRDQVIGRARPDLAASTASPITACPWNGSAAPATPVPIRYEAGARTFEMFAWPVVGDDGVRDGWVHVYTDVTAEVVAAREKGQLAEKLQGTQRLEAIGRLAGGIAHDFNNLLSVIITYAGFAVEGLAEDHPVREDLLEIRTSSYRAATLVRQLLAFSRNQMLAPEPLNLSRVVTNVEGLLRRVLGEDVAIHARLAPDLGSVLADPGQLEQVLMNLVVNARDAMPRGGTLTIETRNVELDATYAEQHVAVAPGSFVQLSVSDTGTGMDAATRDRVFEPFFTTKEQGKGTGLGLSTAYGIVKQSGGNIWVYSEPGRGTTFKLYLPRIAAPAVEPHRHPLSSVATGNETVLVVEDEPAVRGLTARILRGAGYTVLVAASGEEAAALCDGAGRAVDLLLTDVVMPRMSGKEVAERLAPRCPGLKVLYMSGHTEDTIVHHGVLDAGVHLIGKPFSAAELTRMVRVVLDGGR